MNPNLRDRAKLKHFLDPETVLTRDEGGELEQRDFDLDEFKKDMESGYNLADARLSDQLDNSVSAWKNKLSTHKFDYPDDDSANDEFFRHNFATTFADASCPNRDEVARWKSNYEDGRKIYDNNKRFDQSEDGKEYARYDFERRHEDGYAGDEDPDIDLLQVASTDKDKDDAWTAAGYESADMFGEAIDRLAKITGQTALCEAVKKLYQICKNS